MTLKIALALLLASPACAAGEWSARDELARALLESSVNVTGRVSVRVADLKPRRLQVWLAADGRFRRDLLDAKGAAIRTAVSDGRDFWVYDRNRRVAWQGSAQDPNNGLAAVDGADVQLMTKNYQAVFAGSGKVARRACRIIELRSVEGTVLRRVWIDEQYHLPLNIRAFGPRGELLSSFRYLSVEFPRSLPPETFRFSLPPATTMIRSLDRPNFLRLGGPAEARGMRPALPAWTPPAFVLRGVDSADYHGVAVLHFRYSDGLEALSVFQFPDKARLSGDVEEHEPGVRTLQIRRHGRRFLLVGKISDGDLRRMAESIP